MSEPSRSRSNTLRACVLLVGCTVVGAAVWLALRNPRPVDTGGHAKTSGVRVPAGVGPAIEADLRSGLAGTPTARPLADGGGASPSPFEDAVAVKNPPEISRAVSVLPPMQNAPAPMAPQSSPVDGAVLAPAAGSEATDQDLIAIDRVQLSVRDYRTVTGENPTGTNEEIAKALDGGNRRQSRLLPEGVNVSGKGELVDRWGIPYFFHQLSKTDMEIRSAGPDRTLWTGDDLITR